MQHNKEQLKQPSQSLYELQAAKNLFLGNNLHLGTLVLSSAKTRVRNFLTIDDSRFAFLSPSTSQCTSHGNSIRIAHRRLAAILIQQGTHCDEAVSKESRVEKVLWADQHRCVTGSKRERISSKSERELTRMSTSTWYKRTGMGDYPLTLLEEIWEEQVISLENVYKVCSIAVCGRSGKQDF